MSKYIAVKAENNFGGFGIVEIDHTNDTLTYEFFGGDEKAISQTTVQIAWQGDAMGFYFLGTFMNLGDFMRV